MKTENQKTTVKGFPGKMLHTYHVNCFAGGTMVI
jgi:hypothetical protein